MSAQHNIICGECGGRNGHASPFCRKLDLTDALAEEVLEDIDAVLQKHGEVNLRYAILTVIDDGDRDAEGKRVSWALDHAFEDVANNARLRFANAVIQILRQ